VPQPEVATHPAVRRLARRLAVGLFLDRWPVWAGVALLSAGTGALICRMFVPRASPYLPWLWLSPVVAAIPALVVALRRRYRPADLVALADWLGGGHGLLLALFETRDPLWSAPPLVARAAQFGQPRFRLRGVMATLAPAIAFLAIAVLLPQRQPKAAANPALAKQMVADLSAAVAQLAQQQAITPAEEQRLEDEIRQVQQSAERRVDASSWEAADALRQQLASALAAKQDAVRWAHDAVARYAAAAKADGPASANAEARAAELTQALEKLAQAGLAGSKAAQVLRGLEDGTLATDAGNLAELTDALASELGETGGRLAGPGALGAEGGRFDPAEFPTSSDAGPDGDGDPGSGGINRGRGDADLTWGQETKPFDKFKSTPLPPGAARSPDDWTPVVVLPGAPQEDPTLSTSAAARAYADTLGLEAWRRSLAPRHLSAVKKYFGKDHDRDKEP